MEVTWEHASTLASFVFIYKGVCLKSILIPCDQLYIRNPLSAGQSYVAEGEGYSFKILLFVFFERICSHTSFIDIFTSFISLLIPKLLVVLNIESRTCLHCW